MTKQLTNHAQTAKAIRAELKKLNIKAVSVKARSFSNGDSVRVEVENLSPALEKKLKNLVDGYQYGHFNGMEDYYELSNCRDDIPQVKYTMLENNFTDEMYEKAYKTLTPENTIGLNFGELPETYSETRNNYELRQLVEKILRGRDSCNFFSKLLWTNEELGLSEELPMCA